MKKFAATLLLALRVRPSGRFVRRQLRGEEGVHEYEIRATGRRALIRHDTDDPYVLAECFGRLAAYDPPPEIASLLEHRPPKRILDLGANIGLFGLLALDRYPDCEVTGVEADPGNADVHERVIEANSLGDRWRLVLALASVSPGRAHLAAGRSSRSHQVDAGEAGAVEVEAIDAFPLLQEADLVKIDIEGGEWALLGDPRLLGLSAPVIVVEVHGSGCPPGENPRDAAAAALEAAGYQTQVVSEAPERASDPFEGQGTVWAWRG